MFIIGEKINTSVKDVEKAVEKKDAAFIQDLARSQVKAGADALDVNVGTRIHTEVEDMKWAIEVIQEAVEVPLCIDSPNPKVLEAGLTQHKGKAIINSVTAEKNRVEGILPLLKRFRSKVIGLTMDETGIPEDIRTRYAVAERLVNLLTQEGVALKDIYLDPLVRPISTNSKGGWTVLEAMRKIRDSFEGIHLICGLSNISFGLPRRRLLNRVFLSMAMSRGLDAVILDPLDKQMISVIRAGEALLGKDEYCTEYLSSFREGNL
ncbi:MAG: methyltetrahydrofolate cobalamin methyltransferase [bacterium]